MQFKLVSDNQPKGDQPQAISQLVGELNKHTKDQVFTRNNRQRKNFHDCQRHSGSATSDARSGATIKRSRAQLYQEFKTFFPENAVEYFVSYYDYYQPEAYVPASDLYIEKEATVNEEIDRLRLSATRGLFERRDVIVVASVSCIYGLGDPDAYFGMILFRRAGTANSNATNF